MCSTAQLCRSVPAVPFLELSLTAQLCSAVPRFLGKQTDIEAQPVGMKPEERLRAAKLQKELLAYRTHTLSLQQEPHSTEGCQSRPAVTFTASADPVRTTARRSARASVY
ncbi:hypothetical protein NDU88_006637 [Pleurodeles waltl]|uniref:Uncharacterized protein n=1 Tax=Pleurodeles waltl TaxID=8319 RepID=A0AAV7TY65_PLEWA|nr:hypothetical protein NDU88_006637 [Pleurodeles waltl]